MEDGLGFDSVHSIHKRAPINPLAPVKVPAAIVLSGKGGGTAGLVVDVLASPIFWFKAGFITPGNPATILAAKKSEKVCGFCTIIGPVIKLSAKKGALAAG